MTSHRPQLVLSLVPDAFAICRLGSDEVVPTWLLQLPMWSATRTCDELSLVLPQDQVPAGWQAERGWRCLRVRGPLDFGLTGVISSLTAVLAASDVTVFVLSTFDTDYVFVREGELSKAVHALRVRKYVIEEEP